MQIQKITKAQIPAVIAAIPKSAIFTVEFVKKDHTVRKMNCRTGVTKYIVTPEKRQREAVKMPSNIVTVFDMQAHEYRNFNIDTTIKIVAEHTVFVVKG